jgi:hypothetical protein
MSSLKEILSGKCVDRKEWMSHLHLVSSNSTAANWGSLG